MLFDRVLVVGAHVDDAELFAGGTIARFASTTRIMVFSRHWGILPSPEEEFRRSCEVLGLECGHCISRDLPACQPAGASFHANRHGIYRELESLRNSYKPTLVITHQSTDTNQDHRQVHEEVLRVFRKTSILCGTFLLNDLPSADRRFFVAVDSLHLQKKIDALSCYESQIREHRTYFDPALITCEARVYGEMVGEKYAEAFEVIRLHV
jgi:LmbE family N-acetylglucosaminyl deacetylase